MSRLLSFRPLSVILDIYERMTIRYHDNLDERISEIGIGYYRNIYEGVWGKLTTTLKAIAPTMPQKLFQHKIVIWKSFSYLNTFMFSWTCRDPSQFRVHIVRIRVWSLGCGVVARGMGLRGCGSVEVHASGREGDGMKEELHGDLKVPVSDTF